jgi:hypothetical protein
MHNRQKQRPWLSQGTPVDASITVEVFIGASDRFGGKIVAMICRRARATMLWALHAYIFLSLGRATRPGMHTRRRRAAI